MIGLDPDIILKVEKGEASINRNAGLTPDAFTPVSQPPLEALRALVAESQSRRAAGLPSTAAGIYGYLGYDMVRLHGGAARPPRGRARVPRVDPDAALAARRVRHGEGRALRHRPGLRPRRRQRPAGLGRRAGAHRRCRCPARPHPALFRRACPSSTRSRCAPTRTPADYAGWSRTPRSTSGPATSSRSC